MCGTDVEDVRSLASLIGVLEAETGRMRKNATSESIV